MALLIALTLVFTLFVPIWATEETTTNVTETEVTVTTTETSTETETSVETEAPRVIENVEVSPEQVMDYTKTYHVATITVKDCAKIKWYFLTVDGAIYNLGSVNEHHDSTYEIRWNSLDVNGCHPAGAWNKPTTVRFSLVIVATSIAGVEEAYETWFNYTWYDGDCTTNTCPAPTTTTTQPAAPVSTPVSTAPKSDVPHTGL